MDTVANLLLLQEAGGGYSAAAYASRLINTYSANEVWLLNDGDATIRATNNSARNGSYTSVDIQNAAGPGVLSGENFASWDGANDYGDIFSTGGGVGLADIWDGQEGWVFAAIKVSAVGVWTDATVRELLFLRSDGNNQILLDKSATANTLRFRYFAAATTETINAGSQTSTDWITIALRWSLSADTVTALVNGSSVGTSSTLGTYAEALTEAWIGSSTAPPTAVWSGAMGVVAMRFGNAGSNGDILNMHNDLMTGW